VSDVMLGDIIVSVSVVMLSVSVII